MRAAGQRGFTLLEVLVATAIMGIAVAGVMSGLAQASRNASRLTQYDQASMLARQKMDELLVDSAVPRNVPFEGVFVPAQSGWRARVAPFETRSAQPRSGEWLVERVELEVWWMDGPVRRSFALDGYRRAIVPRQAPQ